MDSWVLLRRNRYVNVSGLFQGQEGGRDSRVRVGWDVCKECQSSVLDDVLIDSQLRETRS